MQDRSRRCLLVSLRRGNRPHQRSRVDLIRHSSLREVDPCEQEEGCCWAFLNRAHATDLQSSAFSTFESIQIARRIFGLDSKQSHFGDTRRTRHKRSERYARWRWIIHDEHQAPISGRSRVKLSCMPVSPLAHGCWRLFGWSQLFQQPADVGRVQRVLAFTIDATISAT